MKRGNPRRYRTDVEAAHREEIQLGGDKLRAAQTSVTLVPRAKEASMAGRTGLPKGVLGLATGVVLLAALGFSVSAASSQESGCPEARRHSTRRRTARGSRASPAPSARSGPRTSRRSRWARRSSTSRRPVRPRWTATSAIYAGRGTVATGHCLLRFATGVGLCTISDGTGTLAGFHVRVRVTADSSIPNLWHWDGTYSFDKG